MAGVWSGGAATISGVTDDAGNTYTKVTSVKASEDTELSVWSAPITAGGGTRPAITITATGSADIGGSRARVLRAVAPRPAPRPSTHFKTATGTAGAAGSSPRDRRRH